MFATLLKKDNALKSESNSLLKLAFQLIWAGTACFSISCFFFREEIMLWLYPQTADSYYGSVLAFIILTLVPFSGIYIYSTLLTANGNLKQMNQLFVFGIIINVGLNLWLIPVYKAVGAGMAAFCTQSFVLIGQIFLVHHKLQLPFEVRQLIKIASYTLLLVVTSWLLYNLHGTGWLLRFSINICIGLVLSILFGLINPKSLLLLAKK
jgi:O-antigen/teichoic acid export membrane protein